MTARTSDTRTAGDRRNISPEKPTPGSVLHAVENGTHEDVLVALRDLIARRVDEGVSPRDLVGLSRRLVDLAAEIQALRVRKPLALVPTDGAFDPEVI